MLADLVAADGAAVPPETVHARSAGRRAAQALVSGSCDQAATHLHSVLGFGPGTTPSGDDVAAGVLLAAHALLGGDADRGVAGRLGAAVVAAARERTGAVSLAMLDEARYGRGTEVAVRTVDALLGRGAALVAFSDLLAVGHHSGADMAAGIVALAQALSRRDPVARG